MHRLADRRWVNDLWLVLFTLGLCAFALGHWVLSPGPVARVDAIAATALLATSGLLVLYHHLLQSALRR